MDDKGKHYYYHSCHVCEEEMLNRHETDLTTLIQGLHFNNKNKIEIIHNSNRFI